MELLVTIAYFCLVWLIFYKFRVMRFNLLWKFVVFGFYGAAVLTEVILLGQTTPYSKELVVERFVIPLAPEFGGIVSEVHAKPNVPIKKGTPIFSMDAAPWQDRLDSAKADVDAAANNKKALQAQLAEADLKLRDAKILVAKKVMAANQLEIRQDQVNGLKAQIASIESQMEGLRADAAKAQYNVDHATILAPADGYMVDFVLRPGGFIRLKSAVATFVSTEELYLLASVDQRASQWIRPGDEAHFALAMYPGRLFKAEVDHIIWATSAAQIQATGILPREEALAPSRIFFVKLKPVGDFSETPLEFGANGITAIFTSKAIDLVKVIRMIEIQSESLLNYIYNPF